MVRRFIVARRSKVSGAGWLSHDSLGATLAYASELNPAVGVLQHLKHVEIRNLYCTDLENLRHELNLPTVRLHLQPYLMQPFFAGAVKI
jgi:hypothetical protein